MTLRDMAQQIEGHRPDYDTRDREGSLFPEAGDFSILKPDEPSKLGSAETSLKFIMAGNAYFTIRSTKTGNRYTFRVSKPKDQPDNHYRGDIHFVSLLTGPQNTSDYTYMGMIRDLKFRITKASHYKTDSTPVRAFLWVFEALCRGTMPLSTEIWHEGRCGRCGRPLTVPESIAAGLGPECAGKL